MQPTVRRLRVVRRVSFAAMDCSVAHALEVVGEWWTMLIVRLDKLVELGVLEKVPYQERPVRHEYRLTTKGRDLWPVLNALRPWGDRWAVGEDGPPVAIVHRGCGQLTQAELHCEVCGE